MKIFYIRPSKFRLYNDLGGPLLQSLYPQETAHAPTFCQPSIRESPQLPKNSIGFASTFFNHCLNKELTSPI